MLKTEDIKNICENKNDDNESNMVTKDIKIISE